MSQVLAVFADAAALAAAAEATGREGFVVADALSPYPLEGMGEAAGGDARVIGWAAALGAALGGGGVFVLESFSAGVAYPFDSGGRPLFSWPVFVLAAFEIGVLCAGAFAFAAFLWRTGLPRLNHPLFEMGSIERASQDRFMLLFERPASVARHAALAALLKDAVEVREVAE